MAADDEETLCLKADSAANDDPEDLTAEQRICDVLGKSNQPLSRRQIQATLRLRTATISDALDRLHSLGRIRRDDQGSWKMTA